MWMSYAALLAASPALPAGPTPAQEPVRTDRYGDPLPPGALARFGTTRLRHGGQATCVAFAPDGKAVVSGGQDGAIRIWDAATGRELRRILGHKESVKIVAVSPDGKTIASGGENRRLRLWDFATGKLRHEIEGSWEVAAAFAPAGNFLAVCGSEVRLWEPSSGKSVGKITIPEQRTAECLAFGTDGKTLATGGSENAVRLWDPTTGKQLGREELFGQRALWLAFQPDGGIVVADSRGSLLVLRPGKPGGPRTLLKGTGHRQSPALSPDGTLLAVSDPRDGSVRLLEVATGKELRRLIGHGSWCPGLAFAPDGKMLASAGQDGTVRLWDVTTGKERLEFRGHAGPVEAALSADGRAVACGSDGPCLTLWEADSGRRVRRRKFEPAGSFHSCWLVAYRADGKTLICSVPGVAVWVIDAGSGSELRRWELDGSDWHVAASADGRRVAITPFERGAYFLDSDTGTKSPRIDLLAIHGTLSADGGTLAARVGELNSRVSVWDLTSGKEIARFRPKNAMVGPLAFSPAGGLLAFGAPMDGGLVFRLWEFGNEAVSAEPLEVKGTGGSPYALTFSSDGRTLASGGGDGTVRLWEVLTGKERARLPGRQGPVGSLGFSRDRRRLVSGSWDTTALLWDATGRGGRPVPATLPAEELRTRWDALAGDDAAAAYRAVWDLADAPRSSVPFLRGRVLPTTHPEAARLSRLVADLDNEAFATREQARAELQKLGEVAGFALEKAAASTSTEVRRQAKQLLKTIRATRVSPSGDRLRELRAVAVLEAGETPEAKDVLRSLADGAPGDRLTREAQAALGRLGK